MDYSEDDLIAEAIGEMLHALGFVNDGTWEIHNVEYTAFVRGPITIQIIQGGEE